MNIADGDKTITLEQLAAAICNSYAECTEACPAFGKCYRGHTGTIYWLRDILERKQDDNEETEI